MKTITLKQVGWRVKGVSTVKPWGGGKGTIVMDDTFIPLGKLTKGNLHRCINDGRFGVEAILSAECDIYREFEKGFTEYERTILISKPDPKLWCTGI